jgi:hypothetical protein
VKTQYPASLATLAPEARLACATIFQAVKDLHGKDPFTAIDALLWLCNDAYIWLDLLGLTVQPGDVLSFAAGGCNDRKRT